MTNLVLGGSGTIGSALCRFLESKNEKVINLDEKNLLTIIHNNTLLSEKIFSFLEKTKIPFMFASSQLAVSDTPYGVTKLLGEEWTRLLAGQIVRFWNV